MAAVPAVYPFDTGQTVGAKILADIDTALQYLASDPVRLGEAEIMVSRKRRFNYYAVMALDARASLYLGQRDRAWNRATALMDEAERWFPATSNGSAGPADALFSSEIIFRLDHPTLQQEYRNTFDPKLDEGAILSPLINRLQEVYEYIPNDVRYQWSWRFEPNSVGVAVPTFVKYRIEGDGFVPLFRISEAMLIAAECAPDNERGYEYIHALNARRNAPTIRHDSFEDDLIGAYRKEFWGEGQLFFCYKRLDRPSVPNANMDEGAQNMSNTTYVIPIPETELQQR